MAIVDAGGLLHWGPDWAVDTSNVPNIQGITISSSDTRGGFVIPIPKTGLLSRVGILFANVTSAGTTTTVRIETVNGVDPSGTLIDANATGTLTPTTSSMQFATLAGNVSVTAGQMVAIIVGTTGTPNYQVGRLGAVTYRQNSFRTFSSNAGSSWSVSTTGTPIVALEYSDGSYASMPVPPIASFDTYTYANNDTPDEQAVKFTVPAPVRVVGYAMPVDLDANMDVVLYDAGGSELASDSITPDGRASTLGRWGYMSYFPTAATLAAGTHYLGFRPSSTSAITIYGFTAPSVAALTQWTFPGHRAFRTDAGAWTDDTDATLFASLLIDGIDDGAGGGGGGTPNIFESRVIR